MHVVIVLIYVNILAWFNQLVENNCIPMLLYLINLSVYYEYIMPASLLTLAYLDSPFPSGVNLEVECSVRPNNPLQGWSWSPYGFDYPQLEILNTSLAKYTESGSTLHINAVNTTDEGLYRCVYQSGYFENKLYIHVYGKYLA